VAGNQLRHPQFLHQPLHGAGTAGGAVVRRLDALAGRVPEIWQPKTIWRFDNDSPIVSATTLGYTPGQVLKAWSPFIILIVMMIIWGLPAFKSLGGQRPQMVPRLPGVAGAGWGGLYQMAPVVAAPTKYAASYRMDLFSAPGTAMLLSSLMSMAVLGIRPGAGGAGVRQDLQPAVAGADHAGIGHRHRLSWPTIRACRSPLGLAFAFLYRPAVSDLLARHRLPGGLFLTGSGDLVGGAVRASSAGHLPCSSG